MYHLKKVMMLMQLLEYILNNMKYKKQFDRMVYDSQLVLLLIHMNHQYYPLISDQMLWLQLNQ